LKTKLVLALLVVIGAVNIFFQYQMRKTVKNPNRQDVASAERQKAMSINEMNNSKQYVLGMIMFADDNQNQFPTNFDQMASYFGKSARKNLSDLEIVYQGSLTNIAKPADIIIVRENQPWQFNGKWAKVYGFADGHSELHIESDGSFDAYEKQHIISSPNQ
jgi:hypothetical protein